MAITIHEHFESRRVGTGHNPWAELKYTVFGTDDQPSALITLEAGSPIVLDVYDNGSLILWREDADVEQIGPELWSGMVRYGTVPPAEESLYEFDIGGVTQHMTHSLATIARYAPTGKTAPNHNGAVGVTPNGIEGTDVIIPEYKWAETHYLPASAITPTYKAIVYSLVGKTNNAVFRNFAICEVRFDGLLGRKRGGGDWEASYRFTASQSIADHTIGEGANAITGIAKKGWDYLWVEWDETVDGGQANLVRIPKAVHVEKMLYYGDFSLLGIGT